MSKETSTEKLEGGSLPTKKIKLESVEEDPSPTINEKHVDPEQEDRVVESEHDEEDDDVDPDSDCVQQYEWFIGLAYRYQTKLEDLGQGDPKFAAVQGLINAAKPGLPAGDYELLGVVLEAEILLKRTQFSAGNHNQQDVQEQMALAFRLGGSMRNRPITVVDATTRLLLSFLSVL